MADIKKVLIGDKFAIKAHVKIAGKDKGGFTPEWKVEQGQTLVKITPSADGHWCEVETLAVGAVVVAVSVGDVVHSCNFNVVDPDEKPVTITVEVFPSLKEKAKKAAEEKKKVEKK